MTHRAPLVRLSLDDDEVFIDRFRGWRRRHERL